MLFSFLVSRMVRRWCEKPEPFSQVIREEIQAVQDFEEEHLVSSAASQLVEAALERQGEELQVSQLRISLMFRLRTKRLEVTGFCGRRRTNVRIQMCALAHDNVLITGFSGSGAPFPSRISGMPLLFRSSWPL